MHLKNIMNLFLLILAITLVSACGNSTSEPKYESVTTTSYKIEYIPLTTAAEGKTTYKLRLTNKTTGATVAGKTITLAPTMTMIPSTSHSTPYDALSSNGDGTYSGTIYFVMASIAADGSSMGTWNLEFTVDGETVTFHPNVAMAMGSIIKLKGVNDKIGSMLGSTSRTYQVFNDGIVGSNAKFFITAVDDSAMMTFPAVSVGTTLHNQMNTAVPVTDMTVDVSNDKATWTALSDNGSGRWSKSGLAPLAAGSHLYVRLTVNGEQKTTDGAAVGASNAYGDFTIVGM
ncbi:MAG: hypothetical protein WCI45_08105 [Desulfuromonadales bacterium]